MNEFKIERRFIGGELDGKTLLLDYETHTYHHAKMKTLQVMASESDAIPENFDYPRDTYHYDPAQDAMVEESIASESTMKWATFRMQKNISEWLVLKDQEVLKIAKEYMREDFNGKTRSHILEFIKTVGIEVNALDMLMRIVKRSVKTIRDLEDELQDKEYENLRLKAENARLTRQLERKYG